jgi:hypothetical protein
MIAARVVSRYDQSYSHNNRSGNLHEFKTQARKCPRVVATFKSRFQRMRARARTGWNNASGGDIGSL